MKVRSLSILSAVVLSLSLVCAASGQRALTSDEILQVVKTLTSQSRSTWLPTGTIEARHYQRREARITDAALLAEAIDKQVRDYVNSADKIVLTSELQKLKLAAIPFNVRYKLTNAYTMDGREIVKFDGERFYCETVVDSRKDSVVPDSTLADNAMTAQFRLSFNQRNICAWDGSEYVTYASSGRFATVDAGGLLPRSIQGPLTAGLIPWGSGRFGQANLVAADISAIEQSLDKETLIQMTIRWKDGLCAALTLDPARDYAVIACTLPRSDGTVSVNSYGNYTQVAGGWIPSTILVETHDLAAKKVLSSDLWTFSRIDGETPTPDSFTVQYEPGTMIQYVASATTEPTLFTYSTSMDVSRLLTDRLAYMAAQGRQPQNCATAAVGYVASRLGKTVPGDLLAALVEPDGRTTLDNIRRLIENLGLYCVPVRSDDPATLQRLGSAKAILHIPEKKHVVVVDSVDERQARIVDLSDKRFFYVQDTRSFSPLWSGGLVLLVSSTPITGVRESVDDAGLSQTIGEDGWSCTKMAQDVTNYLCAETCDGVYTFFWKRYICEWTGTGSCTERPLVWSQESDCLTDPIWECRLSSTWYYRMMDACK